MEFHCMGHRVTSLVAPALRAASLSFPYLLGLMEGYDTHSIFICCNSSCLGPKGRQAGVYVSGMLVRKEHQHRRMELG